jgi:hypothetical protein
MATQKLQVGRALKVIQSDTANIPFPAVTISSTITALSGFTLTDSTADFIALGVQAGDILYSYDTNYAATVQSVQSATTLVLNLTTGFLLVGNDYTIYNGQNNNGCVLYIGVGPTSGAGDIAVITVGGDEVVFKNVTQGQFIPVQVIRLSSEGTTATNILALW